MPQIDDFGTLLATAEHIAAEDAFDQRAQRLMVIFNLMCIRHYQRVSELIAANTREVEARRASLAGFFRPIAEANKDGTPYLCDGSAEAPWVYPMILAYLDGPAVPRPGWYRTEGSDCYARCFYPKMFTEMPSMRVR